MKKLTLCLLAFIACSIALQGCDDTKTYAEMLEEEEDAINAFIKDSSIVVISQSQFHAQDSTTDVTKNEYVHLASGVYMQIVDKGSELASDTVKNNDELLVRFSEYDLINQGLTYSNIDIPYTVDAFRYTVTSSSIAATFIEGYYMYNTGSLSTSVPAGWLVALTYVRDRAHVRLIVPSKMGSASAMSAVYPYYYDIKYQIYK